VSGYGQFCPVSKVMELLDERSLAMVWRGDLGWAEALRSGRVEVLGPRWARRAVPRWLGQSPLAGVPRVAAAAT
jgi:hypothetical protein